MPQEPQIEILSYNKRQRFFFVLCVLFLILFPAMIFYTTGYRIDLNDSENRIVTTGGIYVTTDNLDVDVFLNDDQVQRPRLFRSAYYIQDIESGPQRVVVQREGLHTWVKELPVDPYIVVEAAAFNMPLTPQLRHITEYETVLDVAVVAAAASTTHFFTLATTTDEIFFATTSATSSFDRNLEYDFVASLFSTSSVASSSLMQRIIAEVERFGFSTTTPATTTETEFPQKGNISLTPLENELYARWEGADNNIPYYFCVSSLPIERIAARYGEHVAEQIETQDQSTTSPPLYIDSNRICRKEIRIDRKRQDVLFFDFLPGSSDLVLLQLEDGLYVSEIDDRAWQNTQQIFPGSNFRVLVENDVIYIEQGDLYAELLTNIPESNES